MTTMHGWRCRPSAPSAPSSLATASTLLLLFLSISTAADGSSAAAAAAAAAAASATPPPLCVGGDGSSPLFTALQGRQMRPPASPFLFIHQLLVHTVSFYEAWAAFNGKSKGLLFGTRFKQPASDHSCKNRVIAVAFSLRTAVRHLYPYDLPALDAVLVAFGVSPGSSTGAAVVGTTVGEAVADYFLNDCVNALGNRDNMTYNGIPYSDYTGYTPFNTAYKVKDITRWQRDRLATFDAKPIIEEFSGAQLSSCKPFSYLSPRQFRRTVSRPSATFRPKSSAFQKQAQRLIDLSAGLTDERKVVAEFVNNYPVGGKIPFDTFVAYVVSSNSLSFDRTVEMLFSAIIPIWEGAISVFTYKRKFDSARPKTVIRHSGLFDTISAWGGPGKGTVTMRAREWQPYLGNTPEPEHPSGAVCTWTALSTALSRFLNKDTLNFVYTAPKGSSFIEPGLTPQADITLSIPTFSDVIPTAQLARQLGGFHFEAVTRQSAKLCKAISSIWYNFAQSLIVGGSPSKFSGVY